MRLTRTPRANSASASASRSESFTDAISVHWSSTVRGARAIAARSSPSSQRRATGSSARRTAGSMACRLTARLRRRPRRPVSQNTQPRAQPTWLERQTVHRSLARSSEAAWWIATVSTWLPSPRRTANRTVPSASRAVSASGNPDSNRARASARSPPEGSSRTGRPANPASSARASARAPPGAAPRDAAHAERSASVCAARRTCLRVLARDLLAGQGAVGARVAPARDAGRPQLPDVHHQRDPEPALPARQLPPGDEAPGVQHTVEEAAVEHRVPVAARDDDLQLAGGGRPGPPSGTGALVGDGELTTPDPVEEEDRGEPRMAQAAPGSDVLVEVEPDRHLRRIRTADPPLGAGASRARRRDPPELEHGLLDGVCGRVAARQPEGGEIALAQPLGPEPCDGEAGPAQHPVLESAVEDADQVAGRRASRSQKKSASHIL